MLFRMNLLIIDWHCTISSSRSWEILTFAPRIVVFIRIVGTHNTANEVFHCVHFECPCRPDVLQTYLAEQSCITTTDEHEPSSVTFEEFSDNFRPILDIGSKLDNSSSIITEDAIVQNHTILPFTVKSGSAALYPQEKNDWDYLHLLFFFHFLSFSGNALISAEYFD